MRRCLHSFLVALLTLSMSVDAARACWHVRRGYHGTRHAAVVCPPPVAASCGWRAVENSEVVPMNACAGWELVSDVVVAEGVTDGMVTLGDHSMIAAADGGVVGEPVAPPVPAPSTAAEPTSVAEVVPALQPTEPVVKADVQQTVAIAESVMQPPAAVEPVAGPAEVAAPAAEPIIEQPAEETAPMPTEPPAPPPAPVDQNIFDEVDTAADQASDVGNAAVDPSPEPAAEPAVGAADEVPAPADEPTPPAAEPSPALDREEPPAPPADAAVRPSLEPSRRWIDRSGHYAVVGSLRDVRDDGVCVIESIGRTIEVPLESLSEFDRDYAAARGQHRSPRNDARSPDLARH